MINEDEMSRSRKKTPILGNAIGGSEAIDKRLWHKRMRARERDRLLTDPESEPNWAEMTAEYFRK